MSSLKYPLSVKDALKLKKSFKFWYQRIDLGNEIYTMEIGPAFHEIVWDRLKTIFPKKLKKISVLDIGTNAGYFPIEFKKMGAGKVVGIEFLDEFLEQANIIKKIYRLKNTYYYPYDAHEIHKIKGNFDVVIFTGILYHLKNPLQVIEDVSKKCKDLILIESEAIPENPANQLFVRQGFPPAVTKAKKGFMKFIEARDLNNDPTNWWVPDTECVIGMLKTAGFKYFSKPIFIAETRLVMAASKKKRSIANLSKL